jgi:hypothetical protein
MLKYQSFQKLSLLQLGWLWCAYWRLWPVLLRIKFKQFFDGNRWLARKLTVVPSRPTGRVADSSLAAQIHESVRLASRLHFLDAECLPRSIVLTEMLIARGIQASVVIGVSKKGGQFSSHAWVEVDGIMVAEPESVKGDFAKIDSY